MDRRSMIAPLQTFLLLSISYIFIFCRDNFHLREGDVPFDVLRASSRPPPDHSSTRLFPCVDSRCIAVFPTPASPRSNAPRSVLVPLLHAPLTPLSSSSSSHGFHVLSSSSRNPDSQNGNILNRAHSATPASTSSSSLAISAVQEQDDVFIWSWWSDSTWIPYDDRANAAIERAYFNGDPNVLLQDGIYAQNGYLVIFYPDGSVVQRNERTRNIRPVQRQPPPPPRSQSVSIRWQWFNDELHSHMPYDKATSDMIEQAFTNHLPSITLSHGIFANDGYTIDFTRMIQRNNRTHNERIVRRYLDYVPIIPDVGNAQQREYEEEKTVAEEAPECPICFKRFALWEIAEHVDRCLENVFEADAPSIVSQDFGQLRRSGSMPAPSVPSMPDYDPVTMEQFECLICMDDVPPGAGYRYEQCKHQYCGPCLSGYYSELIMNNKADEIKCPDPTCDHEADYWEVKFLIDDAMFKKYLEFRHPEMRWCPNPLGCGNAIKRADSTSQQMLCKQCNFEFCFDCAQEYHGTKSCEDFAQWKLANNKVDLRLWLWEKFNTKPCPRCKKNGGCNHMTCESCKHEFCWQCLRDYDSNHYDNTWCTMYGKTPVLAYARGIKAFFRYKLTGRFGSDSSSESDDEATFTDRFEAVRERMGEVGVSAREVLAETKTRFLSLFQR